MKLIPEILNVGCGADFREDCFNIDTNPNCHADTTIDLGEARIPLEGITIRTKRFGECTLKPESFKRIFAFQVLQQVKNFDAFMTTCFELLETDALMEITVPYDLSYGAWSDPKNVRAFNEVTFAKYLEDGNGDKCSNQRFEIVSLEYVPGVIARQLQEKNIPAEEIARSPRAVDGLSITLRKSAKPDVPADKRERQNFPDQKPKLKAFLGEWQNIKNRFCIWIVTPTNYIHTRAFQEPALSLSSAFKELGGSAPITTHPSQWAGRLPITFGANVLNKQSAQVLPAGSIIVNMEQATTDSQWMSTDYFEILKNFAVLESSPLNRRRLSTIGIDHTTLLPIGYCPEWTSIKNAPEQDIDVLFYGSLNVRRREILVALQSLGLKVVHLFGVYGAERDATIARSKIVLNIHAQDNWAFETVRVLYLLANKVCVLTEADDNDDEANAYRGGLAVATYDQLVSRCLELLRNDGERNQIAKTGFELVKARTQAQILAEAVGLKR